MQNHYEPHRIYLTTEEKSKPRKQSFFYAKLWHSKFGVTFGQRWHAKINIMWFAT